ncbi:uncharacterized protein LOC110694584 [Chenopodium quinoa]|uniref:uncharacterized protein LOC110694584 n=1 Tax=Chenopodium quinoa TaxID=63459 RepID=UPI000B77CD56|nr:uncharacterized protein LOC110694584 [Chenopodium quinoa]
MNSVQKPSQFPPLIPPEASDQVAHSNKKTKRKITHEIFNRNENEGNPDMEIDLGTQQPGLGMQGDPNNHGKAATMVDKYQRSFRDMLRDTQLEAMAANNIQLSNDEDVVLDDDEPLEDFVGNDRCPVILLTKEEKKAMRRPWRNILIIRMFDGSLGYIGLMKRLKRKWQLKGEMSLTDIGCKYFIARFNNQEDYNFVLTQGPWLIDDKYLTIRKWTPNFIPEEASIKVLTAWVRTLNLSVEYFDKELLKKIGAKIGKVIRVDKSTALC